MDNIARLNIYSLTFAATCPSDGESISYTAQIATEEMIRVEELNGYTATLSSGYHEDIADRLARRFGGAQEVTAIHQGVRITTRRMAQRGPIGPGGVAVQPSMH